MMAIREKEPASAKVPATRDAISSMGGASNAKRRSFLNP
jgi:hypothetical protein